MPSSHPSAQTAQAQWQVNKFLWICLVFMAVFLPLAASHGWVSVPLPAAYGILALAALNGAARTYFGWRAGGFNGPIGWLFTVIDIALISLGVRLTGSIHSELWPLYFVILVSETLYAGPASTIILLSCICAGYVGATWPSRGSADYALALETRLFFVLTVGFFTRQLSSLREARQHELGRLREQIASTEERARIAREIHDGLGHALVAAILRLELCQRLIRTQPDEAEQILREEVPALRAAWAEGRDLAFHLRPWEQSPDGFLAGLRRHLGRFAERTGIAVDLQAADEPWALPGDTEHCLTRVIQEALTNVAKHSGASHVVVRLDRRDGRLRCLVEDDGGGFDAEAASEGFGLRAMQERAEACGGSLRLASRPSSGVTLEMELPA